MLIKQILLGCLAILNPAFVDAELKTVEPNMDGLHHVDFDSFLGKLHIGSLRRECDYLNNSRDRHKCRRFIDGIKNDSVDFEMRYIDEEDYRFECDSETCPKEQYSKRKYGQLKEGPN